jgi:hypothetical protein
MHLQDALFLIESGTTMLISGLANWWLNWAI